MAEYPDAAPTDYESSRVGQDPRYRTVPPYEASLWRRQMQYFQGDPVPGNQHLAPPVAATPLVVPDFALSATLTVTGDLVRISVDGTPAAAGNGIVALVGSSVQVSGRASLKACSIFPNSAASVVDVQYFD
jgi:hypothetical protein